MTLDMEEEVDRALPLCHCLQVGLVIIALRNVLFRTAKRRRLRNGIFLQPS